jgi:hypothetical protein
VKRNGMCDANVEIIGISEIYKCLSVFVSYPRFKPLTVIAAQVMTERNTSLLDSGELGNHHYDDWLKKRRV